MVAAVIRIESLEILPDHPFVMIPCRNTRPTKPNYNSKKRKAATPNPSKSLDIVAKNSSNFKAYKFIHESISNGAKVALEGAGGFGKSKLVEEVFNNSNFNFFAIDSNNSIYSQSEKLILEDLHASCTSGLKGIVFDNIDSLDQRALSAISSFIEYYYTKSICIICTLSVSLLSNSKFQTIKFHASHKMVPDFGCLEEIAIKMFAEFKAEEEQKKGCGVCNTVAKIKENVKQDKDQLIRLKKMAKNCGGNLFALRKLIEFEQETDKVYDIFGFVEEVMTRPTRPPKAEAETVEAASGAEAADVPLVVLPPGRETIIPFDVPFLLRAISLNFYLYFPPSRGNVVIENLADVADSISVASFFNKNSCPYNDYNQSVYNDYAMYMLSNLNVPVYCKRDWSEKFVLKLVSKKKFKDF